MNKAYVAGYRTTRVVLQSGNTVANATKGVVRVVRSGLVGFVAGVRAAKEERGHVTIVEK